MNLLHGTDFFLISLEIEPPPGKQAFRWIWSGALSTLERGKLGWGELGGCGGGRLGSRGKEIEKRQAEEHRNTASVPPSWGQQPSHEPLKIIWWGVECLLPHFLHLMSAHSPLWFPLSVLDHVGPPWDSRENTMLYLTSPLSRTCEQLQLSYQQARNDRAFQVLCGLPREKNKNNTCPW